MPEADNAADNAALESRRRRLLFRSHHRGTHELDLLVGRFAAAHLAGMGAGELDAFERILDLPDLDLFDWLTGRRPVPPDADSAVLRAMIAFAARPGIGA
ncbi:MAG: succinate dehydrogenase assembly factor 2 [Alphaproteobacteria bacterium]|nr:succinate dehydrogenase assembly factor 2 [Alphaproteobacteria bacterium]